MGNCCNNGACESKQETGSENILGDKKFRWLLASLAVIIPFEIASLLSIDFSLWFELPIFAVIIYVFGKDVFISGLKSLWKLNFSNINLLMTIAILGATYLRQFEEAAIIVVLFALGETLEDFGIRKSKGALKDLVDKSPKTAQIKDAKEKTPIEQIKKGDVIIVKPGDQIPLDGTVVLGNSLVDEAVITGEPLPKSKYVGDSVFAGTSNGNGYLEIKVEKEAKDSTLAKIIKLTYESAEQKSNSQKFIESFAKYYTPAIMAIAILLVVVPVFLLGKPFDIWFVRALTLLLISCPCALVISTPVAVFSAIGNATKKGVLIKGGRFLEELGKIKLIAFDKTRTLTKGEPYVSDIIPYNGFTANELLACAAGMEVFSQHPIAKSIIDRAHENNVDVHTFNNFEAVHGKGLKGECLVCVDAKHCLGNLSFVQEENQNSIEVEQYIIEKVSELEEQGKTAIIISDDKKIKGIIAVSDEMRSDSYDTINRVKNLGIKTAMLTGDNTNAAHFIAQQLGIDDVQAALLPEDKIAKITEYLKDYGYVAMIGDGVNDAPALAKSSVGITLGAVGSDLAIENSDIALMNNNLKLIPYLVELGRKCSSKIRFNIALAVGVKAIFILLAVSGTSSLAMAIFADVGVTLIVVANSLSLFRFNVDQK
ncbi:MAG: hypothetical protein ACD_9C00141G0005 [uncultured bacterium]|nr:MAG: hypothetical protein ACD_9C00141G0005 [uncultured bacterium]